MSFTSEPSPASDTSPGLPLLRFQASLPQKRWGAWCVAMNALVLLAGLHSPEKEDEGIPVEFPSPPQGLLLGGLLLQVIIKLQRRFQHSYRQAPLADASVSHAAAAQASGHLIWGAAERHAHPHLEVFIIGWGRLGRHQPAR